MKRFHRSWAGFIVCALVACYTAGRAFATGVPIGGFLPMVGIALTDEFDDNLNTFVVPSTSVTGNLLGAGGQPFYDVALLDTGAAVSLLTNKAFDDFGLGSPSPGQSEGYRGTEVIQIGGATGTLEAEINDPLGLYVGGLQGRANASGPLVMNHAALEGLTNTSMITLPTESELPNVVGLSYASQYATYIRSDQPQIFTLDGKTVRTPSIEFLPRGSGGQGITRRAPLSLKPGSSFQQPPSWLYHIPLDLDEPHEDPTLPTIIQGGLFLNVNLANSGATLNNSSFFFDTGADVSVLSELTALQLGIDVVLDAPDFTVAVVGSGGAKLDVPGYYLDQFTIQALGGSVVANNVPVIVLDVADPSNPANIVPGIVGTNLLAGRNVVIDPNPSLGGGGSSPSLFISDPVTTQHNWVTIATSVTWSNPGVWSGGVPGALGIANLRNVHPALPQEAVLNTDATVWEVNVSGVAGRTMTLWVPSESTLTTFAGINIEAFGVLEVGSGGAVDAQYVEIMGGTLFGKGNIFTGSGPVAGQVENRNGVVAPGGDSVGLLQIGTLTITGRFANGEDGRVDIQIAGAAPQLVDQLHVDGPVTLDGILNASILNLGGSAFVPALGNVFSILTATDIGGEFSTVNLPTLTADKMWQVTYDATAVLLKVTIPGDFDGDFTVDGDDLAVWREDFGRLYSGADFLAWQRNLGMSIAPIAAVPEPRALALGMVALAGLAFGRRAGGLLARG